MGIEVHLASPQTIKRSIFEVLRSYMVSFAMAALRSVFFIQR